MKKSRKIIFPPHNNRKRTRGRRIQEVKLKDKKGKETGKTRIIYHIP